MYKDYKTDQDSSKAINYLSTVGWHCDYSVKAMRLRRKIILKMYLIENKEVTLLMQLNW